MMSRRRSRRFAEPSQQRSEHHRQQARRLSVWTICAVLIVILSPVFARLVCTKQRFSTNPTVLSKVHQQLSDTVMLQYTLAEKGTTQGGLEFHRYVASDLASTNKDPAPISIHQWATLLTSDDVGVMSDSFTHIL